jgi:exodeoxyribonuclease-1
LNYVVWDIETDSAQTDWATIIEIGGILLDENFKEKERFQARCRLPQIEFQVPLHFALINQM